MIIGNPALFAIESEITQAYVNLGLRALGYFVIHVGGFRYGIHDPEATLLAIAFDDVNKRIASRDQHTAPFSWEEAGRIADAYRQAVYADEQDESYLGVPLDEFCSLMHENDIVWAPDGDEGFDDRSNVLQFDVGEQVRIIAFKSADRFVHDPSSLRDIWLSGDEFYGVLQEWRDTFLAEWERLPKVADDAR